MGQKYTNPMQDETETSGYEMLLPIHLDCKSNPQYNDSTNIRITYGQDTHLYDILDQIDDYVSHKFAAKSSFDFEISAVSETSFIDKKIVFSDYKKQNVLKSNLQYELITNYTPKDITTKGVHVILKISDQKEKHIKNTFNKTKNSISNIGQQLKSLDINTNINNKQRKKKKEKKLDERLRNLCFTSDVAYENFDDIMYNFRKKEQLLYSLIDQDFIENKHTQITWRMLTILIDWLYDLQKDLEFNNETLFAAIHYIHLYLSKCTISRKHLQLLGVTAIFLATCTYEIVPQSIDEWIYLSQDQYTRKQILNLQKKLLSVINWRVFQVTPYNYIEPWLQILEINPHSNEKFIIDLLVQSISLNKLYLQTQLSKLVASAFYLAKVYIGNESKFSMDVLSIISGHDINEIKSMDNIIIVQSNGIITELIEKGEKDSMMSAIYRKFTDKEYIKKTYGKNKNIININCFSFNRIFGEWKKECSKDFSTKF